MFRNKRIDQIALLLFAILLLAFSNNPPNGASGAPGDVACSNCHSGGSQLIEYNVLGFPQDNISPNTVYPITVEIIQNSPATDGDDRGGFQMTVLKSSLPSATSSGTLTSTDANASVSFFNGRQYFEHNNGAKFFNGNDTIRYTGTWTAPSSVSVLDINVFATCVVANGNGVPTGDRVGFYNDLGNTFPVAFLKFEVAKYGANEVLLTWITASESEHSMFIIEKSYDAVEFDPIYETVAKGDDFSGGSYEWYDKLQIEQEIIYYRIKELNIDGSFSYSEVKSIKPLLKELDRVSLFPNPVGFNQRISINQIPQFYHEVKISVLDFNGTNLWEQTDCNIRNGKVVIDPELQVNGFYFIRLSFHDQVKTIPLIIQD